MSENGMFMKISGLDRDEVTERLGKLHKEELYNVLLFTHYY